jgi:ABC-type transporter Mla subunit MlaD
VGRERVSAADQPNGVPSDEECVTIGNYIKVKAAAEHLSWHEQGRMIGKALQEVRNRTQAAKNKEIRLLTKERDELKQGLANCGECAAALTKAVSKLEAKLKSAIQARDAISRIMERCSEEVKSARAKALREAESLANADPQVYTGERGDAASNMKSSIVGILRQAAEEAEKEIPSES